jgi:hypothetical protein
MFKRIIDIFFITLIYEGAVRKWMLPDFDLAIQVFRDLLPSVALIFYIFQGYPVRLFGQLNSITGVAFFLYALICVLTLQSLIYQPYVYLVGLRTHFCFVPLLIILPQYFGSWDEFLRRARWLVIISLPVFLLALFQNTQDASSAWNQYSKSTESVATFGLDTGLDVARASGTFSYISGLASFAAYIASLAAYLALSSKTVRGTILPVLAGLLAIGAILASGSRGGIVIVVLQMSLLLILGMFKSALRAPKLAVIILGIGLLLPIVPSVLGLQLSSFETRTTEVGYDEPADRIYGALFEWMDVGLENPFGNGLGSGHQAFYGLLTFANNYWEHELSRIAFEIGLIGVLAYIFFKLSLCWQIVRRLGSDPSPGNKLLRLFCAITCLVSVVSGSLYLPVANALFWLSAGTALWALQRRRDENSSLSSQRQNSSAASWRVPAQ